MNTEHMETFKKKLEDEKALLMSELKSVGRINPDNPGDWEATPAKAQDPMVPDENELGDKFEIYEENAAILKPLETRFNEVKRALAKIESGTGYGICEVCGQPIETDRLEANPAAATCKAHM